MRVTPSFSSLREGVIRNNKTGDETKFRREKKQCLQDDRQTPRGGFCEAGG